MNLVKHRFFLLFHCFVFTHIHTAAQNTQLPKSSYGVPVINTITTYKNSVQNDTNKELVELKTLLPRIVYDLRYASQQNFVHQAVYPVATNKTFLRKPAAQALVQIQTVLQQQKLGIKIFDAYRPYHITVKFWELVKDDRYVANPANGSGHNRGLAIDLTLIDLTTGKELDMGTGFDNFSDTARHSFIQLPATVLKNRQLLKKLMQQYGFVALETEWWHYAWPNNHNYEVMDLPHKKIAAVKFKK
jgi:zinc D-Ala-D-Ala dipeptidase